MSKFSKSDKWYFGVFTLVLLMSFAFNAFGTVTTNGFLLNYKSSEALVVNQVHCQGELYSGQLINVRGGYNPKTAKDYCAREELVPYSSQFGLQGRLHTSTYNALDRVADLEVKTFVGLAKIFAFLSSAVTFALLAMYVKKNIGTTESIFVVLGIAMSPMIVGFSGNLFWAVPTMFAPLLYVLYFYKSQFVRNKAILFWSGAFVLLYIRYLNGYEYVSAFTIMVAAAVAYVSYLSKQNMKEYIKQFALVFVVSLFAFIAAFGTHIYGLNQHTGSTRLSVDLIKKRANDRLGNTEAYLRFPYSNFSNHHNELYRVGNYYFDFDSQKENSTETGAYAVALTDYALLPVIKLPLNLSRPFADIVQSFAFFIIVMTIMYRKRKKWVPRASLRQVEAAFLAGGLGALSIISWMVLARSHSLVHSHINGIMLYYPFGIFAFIIFGSYARFAFKRYTRKK